MGVAWSGRSFAGLIQKCVVTRKLQLHFLLLRHSCRSLCLRHQALFGDVYTHQTSVLPQAESYVHRFGPGLVLYWFGHGPLDRLNDAQGDISIFGWDLPEKFLLPTGDLITSQVSMVASG